MSKRSDTKYVETAAQLRALGGPMRQRVLNALEASGPATVAELAEKLNRKPASLYYHVDALVKAGFVYKAGDRTAGRRSERLYAPVAKKITVDVSRKPKSFLTAFADLASAVLRHADRCHRKALFDRTVRNSGLDRQRLIIDLHARLDRSAIREVNRRVSELTDYIYERDQRGKGACYTIAIVMAPDSNAL